MPQEMDLGGGNSGDEQESLMKSRVKVMDTMVSQEHRGGLQSVITRVCEVKRPHHG